MPTIAPKNPPLHYNFKAIIRPELEATKVPVENLRLSNREKGQVDSRLTISAAILYLVTTRSSAMVGSSAAASAAAGALLSAILMGMRESLDRARCW